MSEAARTPNVTILADVQQRKSAQPHHCTDQGNAERLIEAHGADLLYCFPRKTWYVFDGVRFAPDQSGSIYQRAKETVRNIYSEAARCDDPEERKTLSRWAALSESTNRLEGMIALARSDVPVMPRQLDTDPMLLNTLNGTIELCSGKLRPHARADLITKLAPVEYDPAATAPRWEQFLTEVMPDPEERAYLQRASGFSITGDPSEEKLFFAHGGGQNGKTTYFNAMRRMLGDYARQAVADLLIARQGDRHSTEIADLWGMRFVTTVETEENRRLAEVQVKLLTGGDPITARRMHQNSEEYLPTHHLWLASNHRPVIRGTDLAIWVRIHLVPFVVTIAPERRDKHLADTLKAELPGILAWAVRGCLEWQRIGLQPPQAVTGATEAYRSEQDTVGRYLAERCVLNDKLQTGASKLYADFKRWCDEQGERDITQTMFGRRLTARGIRSEGSRNVRRLGIGLLTDEESGATR